MQEMISKELKDHIRRASEEVSTLDLFVVICARALSQASKESRMIDLIERTSKLIGEPSRYSSKEDLAKAKGHAREIETFAKAQKDLGFPFLYSLAVIRLWSILEALVDDFAASLLKDPSFFKDEELLHRLKGPVIEFIGQPQEKQAELLVDLLKGAVQAASRSGANRFEVLLNPLDFSGIVDPTVGQIFVELCNVRNVIAHNSGNADERFLKACPWLTNITAGDQLTVTNIDFHLYLTALFCYLLELKGRVFDHTRGERPFEHRSGQAEVLKHLRDLMAKRKSAIRKQPDRHVKRPAAPVTALEKPRTAGAAASSRVRKRESGSKRPTRPPLRSGRG